MVFITFPTRMCWQLIAHCSTIKRGGNGQAQPWSPWTPQKSLGVLSAWHTPPQYLNFAAETKEHFCSWSLQGLQRLIPVASIKLWVSFPDAERVGIENIHSVTTPQSLEFVGKKIQTIFCSLLNTWLTSSFIYSDSSTLKIQTFVHLNTICICQYCVKIIM